MGVSATGRRAGHPLRAGGLVLRRCTKENHPPHASPGRVSRSRKSEPVTAPDSRIFPVRQPGCVKLQPPVFRKRRFRSPFSFLRLDTRSFTTRYGHVGEADLTGSRPPARVDEEKGGSGIKVSGNSRRPSFSSSSRSYDLLD